MFVRVMDIGFTETLVDFICKARIEVRTYYLFYLSESRCVALLLYVLRHLLGHKFWCLFDGQQEMGRISGSGCGSAQIEPIMRQRRRRRIRITYVCSHAYGTRAGGIVSLI